MNMHQRLFGAKIGYALRCICAVLALVFCIPAEAQCDGLHAGITAQFVRLKPGYTEPAHVQLVFLLINDSEAALDVRPGSWKIVVDGIELKDSDFILGNGPVPTGGWIPLQPGAYYELGKTLPANQYFGKPGKHTVAWKGEGFHSSTITIDVP